MFADSVISPADICTPAELSKRLKVPQSWIYNKLRPHTKNPLPVFRIGHYLRFDWRAVSAWLVTTNNQNTKAAAR
jgi:hypothetical protein